MTCMHVLTVRKPSICIEAAGVYLVTAAFHPSTPQWHLQSKLTGEICCAKSVSTSLTLGVTYTLDTLLQKKLQHLASQIGMT